MEPPSIIYEDHFLRVATLKGGGSGGRALLSFTGIGHALGGLDVQQPEFTKASGGYDRIFYISDLTRSWGNRLDFGLIKDLLQRDALEMRYDAVRNSMGGFLALLAPGVLPIEHTLAFVPQFSVHPKIAIWETRWQEYRKAILSWKYESLEGVWNDATSYFVFSSSHGLDAEHATRIPAASNITVTMLGGDHAIAQQLKSAGLLNETVTRCMNETYSKEWLLNALASAEKSAGDQ